MFQSLSQQDAMSLGLDGIALRPVGCATTRLSMRGMPEYRQGKVERFIRETFDTMEYRTLGNRRS